MVVEDNDLTCMISFNTEINKPSDPDGWNRGAPNQSEARYRAWGTRICDGGETVTSQQRMSRKWSSS